MSPIYNPSEASSSKVDNGEDYFKEIGLLDGMTQLIDEKVSFPTPDGIQADLTTSIVGSALHFTFTSEGDKVYQFNLDATQERILIVGYFHGGNLNSAGLLAGTDTHTGTISSVVTDCYHGGSSNHATTEFMNLRRIVGSPAVYANIAVDSTIFVKTNNIFSRVFGLALYCNSASGSEEQTLWMQGGASSQWFQILTATDTTAALNTGFNAIGAQLSYFNADAGFQVCPLAVWGAE